MDLSCACKAINHCISEPRSEAYVSPVKTGNESVPVHHRYGPRDDHTVTVSNETPVDLRSIPLESLPDETCPGPVLKESVQTQICCQPVVACKATNLYISMPSHTAKPNNNVQETTADGIMSFQPDAGIQMKINNLGHRGQIVITKEYTVERNIKPGEDKKVQKVIRYTKRDVEISKGAAPKLECLCQKSNNSSVMVDQPRQSPSIVEKELHSDKFSCDNNVCSVNEPVHRFCSKSEVIQITPPNEKFEGEDLTCVNRPKLCNTNEEPLPLIWKNSDRSTKSKHSHNCCCHHPRISRTLFRSPAKNCNGHCPGHICSNHSQNSCQCIPVKIFQSGCSRNSSNQSRSTASKISYRLRPIIILEEENQHAEEEPVELHIGQNIPVAPLNLTSGQCTNKGCSGQSRHSPANDN